MAKSEPSASPLPTTAVSKSKEILLNGRKARDIEHEGDKDEETVLRCSMVVSRITSLTWRARRCKWK